MARWLIGDVHGCHLTLAALVARLDLRAGRDEVWLAGDLVNRGQGSLAVLRWAYAERQRVKVVLGNHDLRLLMAWRGAATAGRHDTLGEVLADPGREVLLLWLARQPLWMEAEGAALVHAGVMPSWSRARARQLAERAARALAGADRDAFLQALAARPRDIEAAGVAGAAAAAAHLTQLRMLAADGTPLWGFVGAPSAAPPGARPWFAHARALAEGGRLFFGHWSALGPWADGAVACLDSGCVWGRTLTAWRLEDDHRLTEPCHPDDGPRAPAPAPGLPRT